MSNEHLERIEAKIDRVITGQAEHIVVLNQHTVTLTDHSALLTNHTKRLDKLEIGQEELRDAVAQIAEGHAVIVRQLDKGFQSVHAVIHERLEPRRLERPPQEPGLAPRKVTFANPAPVPSSPRCAHR